MESKTNRFFRRLGTSIPLAAEDAVVSLMSPEDTLADLGNFFLDKATTFVFPGGPQLLAEQAKDHVKRSVSSPESLADLAVDAASIYATKKLPWLRSTKVDDFVPYAKSAGQRLVEDYKQPRVLGEKFAGQMRKGTNALIAAGEKDSRYKNWVEPQKTAATATPPRGGAGKRPTYQEQRKTVQHYISPAVQKLLQAKPDVDPTIRKPSGVSGGRG